MSFQIFSIVVPIYQNEANLDDTIPKLLGLESHLPGIQIELVFVDDGSKDASLSLLHKWRALQPSKIKVVKLTRNFGQNPAILAGLRYATGSCVGIISADLQEPHETFVAMVDRWKNGSKYVIGVREGRTDGRKPMAWLYWRMLHWFFSPNFPRSGYDFCLLDRQVVRAVNKINERNTSVFTLLFWLGFAPDKVPVTRRRRLLGKSQNTFVKRARIAFDTFIGFTHLPVRFVTASSLVLALSSLLYLSYLLVRYFFFGHGPEGWMTIVALLLSLGSVTLLGLGIIAEYLWRILDEVRKRPAFVVESAP